MCGNDVKTKSSLPSPCVGGMHEARSWLTGKSSSPSKLANARYLHINIHWDPSNLAEILVVLRCEYTSCRLSSCGGRSATPVDPIVYRHASWSCRSPVPYVSWYNKPEPDRRLFYSSKKSLVLHSSLINDFINSASQDRVVPRPV